jgi:hypothetical protein
MRFQATGTYTQGTADVDPVAAPTTILTEHFFDFKKNVTTTPTKLILDLAGASAETVTVSVYTLLEHLDESAKDTDYKASAATRWVAFATGQVITNGTLTVITSGLPAGGPIYIRRTADAITTGQTRKLSAAWA